MNPGHLIIRDNIIPFKLSIRKTKANILKLCVYVINFVLAKSGEFRNKTELRKGVGKL